MRLTYNVFFCLLDIRVKSMKISKSMKIFLGCFLWHKNLQIPHYLNGSQSRNDSGYFMSSANKGNLFKRLEHEKHNARLVSQCAIPFFPWPSQVAVNFDWASDVGWVTSLCQTHL